MWDMGLSISRQHITQLIDFAQKSLPEECCGLLFGVNGAIHDVQLSRNMAAQADKHFEIDPADLLRAQRAERTNGPIVIGYFHSHPNGRTEPSIEDAHMAIPDGRYWLIIAHNNVSAWQALEDGDLHGRFNRIKLDFKG